MRVINIAGEYQYIFNNGKVVKKELVKEKGIVTSFLHPRFLFSITKKFDKHFSEEDILLEMEKYIYTYPGIDINKEYKTIFLKIQRDRQIILEAILVDVEELKEYFKRVLSIYKYIDFISPSFLGWKEYYNLTKLEPKNDIFIYFSKNEAFLSAYNNKNYLFHKPLNRLATLAKVLNKSEDEVVEILKTKGLDANKYENQDEFSIIEKFFSEFFLKVFNIINFSSNDYQIAKFDRIIFYSPFEIKGLFEQYKNYWELNGIEFRKSAIKTEYDHLEYLITFFNAKNFNNDEINLSVFKKPPPIWASKFGKFILFFILSISIIISFSIYEFLKIKSLQEDISLLQKRLFLLKKKHNIEAKLLEKYKKENQLLLSKINKLNQQIKNIGLKIDFLYKKAKSPLFYNVIAKIAKSMKKHSLKASKIIKNKNHITIIIVSTYDNAKEVTSFMKDLMRYGFKDVKSDLISNENNFYISRVDFKYE